MGGAGKKEIRTSGKAEGLIREPLETVGAAR